MEGRFSQEQGRFWAVRANLLKYVIMFQNDFIEI